MNKNKWIIPLGWRALFPNEIIKDGDKFVVNSNDVFFERCHTSIGHKAASLEGFNYDKGAVVIRKSFDSCEVEIKKMADQLSAAMKTAGYVNVKVDVSGEKVTPFRVTSN